MPEIKLVPMTDEMYHAFFKEYKNDRDLYVDQKEFEPYVYSVEKVKRYIERQKNLDRITFAIMEDDDIAGEIIIKNIELGKCATMSIMLKNASYKDRGIGTRAERLAVRFVFEKLGIPVFYADALKTNTRSRHVLEKVGFSLIKEDSDLSYYKIEKEKTAD